MADTGAIGAAQGNQFATALEDQHPQNTSQTAPPHAATITCEELGYGSRRLDAVDSQ
jgi:hypothetical protein